jgi:hypothetical protein
MHKPVVGILWGAVLGFLDGLTSWFTPAVRPELLTIAISSSFKGMITGVLAGLLARKVNSVAWGVVFGAGLGLLFAWGVAAMPSATGEHYYVQIMLPGFIEGALIGFLTQRLGKAPARVETAASSRARLEPRP